MGGIFSKISDTLFGDGGEGAQEQAAADNALNRQFSLEAINRGRADIAGITPGLAESRQTGNEAAANIFRQTFPAQADIFQQGNVGAQQVAGQGLLQQNNALLGTPLDLGFTQAPTRLNFDNSIFQQQAPTFAPINFGGNQPAPTGGGMFQGVPANQQPAPQGGLQGFVQEVINQQQPPPGPLASVAGNILNTGDSFSRFRRRGRGR